jgi:glyoxylase-like metal-dependent hydrolase (beta-lactamase superfamily II)
MDRLTGAGGPYAPQRWAVGGVRITRIEESAFRLPIQQLIPLADLERLDRHQSWLSPAQVDAEGTMTLVIGAFMVESRGRRLLVDTCIGPEHERGDKGARFLRRLDAAGFPPASIDAVLCTHVHFDHIGWNTVVVNGVRRPTFENADYFFCQDEWAVQQGADPVGVLSAVGHNVAWLLGTGRASLVPATHRFTDEVSFLPTFGHSPGHVAVLVNSGGRQAVITGDAVHHPVQLAEPELTTTADFDPPAAVRSRTALIDRVTNTGALLLGTHFADPCAVKLTLGNGDAPLHAVAPVQLPAGGFPLQRTPVACPGCRWAWRPRPPGPRSAYLR